MVVQGNAIIIPTIPIKAPQMESDNKIIAGFNPVIFPITLGTMRPSWMTCTMQNTINAQARIHQKFSPVSAAFSKESRTVGTKATSWRYGTMFNNPMNNPKPIASGKSMMRKPILKSIPTRKATNACPRKYRFIPSFTSFTIRILISLYFFGTKPIQPLAMVS